MITASPNVQTGAGQQCRDMSVSNRCLAFRFSGLRRFLLLVSAAVLWAGFDCPKYSIAHEYENGHIERSVDVILRNQKLQVKYAIGMSDETIVEWLERKRVIDSARAAKFRAQISEFESSNENPSGKVLGKAPTGNKGGGGLTAAAQEVPPAAPLQFQTELSALLNQHFATEIAANLKLKLDGAPFALELNRSAPSPRHHVRLEMTLTATIPDCKQVSIVFSDHNFLDLIDERSKTAPERPTAKKELSSAEIEHQTKSRPLSDNENPRYRYTGKIRKAMRVKGNAVLLSSNSVPVLARAKPIDIDGKDVKQRTYSATIESKVTFADSRGR